VIVTQDFHLPRAVFIARALGMRAYGLSVSRAGTLFDYVREIPAAWKAMWDVFTHLHTGADTPTISNDMSVFALR
jgi:vancomycin permeability regulator SanA